MDQVSKSSSGGSRVGVFKTLRKKEMEKDREWPNRQELERIRRVMPRRIRDGETRAGNKRRKCR